MIQRTEGLKVYSSCSLETATNEGVKMISRRTTKCIAELYVSVFRKSHGVSGSDIYNFLYLNEYESWFCIWARTTTDSTFETRRLLNFIMGLHTGETLLEVTPEWPHPKRIEIGTDLLFKLAGDILRHIDEAFPKNMPSPLRFQRGEVIDSLRLDGYKYQNSELLTAESEIFDTQETAGVLAALHKELGLANSEIAFHHLKKSEERYLAGEWGDCISNSRSFHQAVLQEVAASYSIKFENTVLAKNTYDNAGPCREYCVKIKLINEEEKKALSAVYGLLSDTGSHPYIADRDQARLLRQMSLILSEFVMLRYQGGLASTEK